MIYDLAKQCDRTAITGTGIYCVQGTRYPRAPCPNKESNLEELEELEAWCASAYRDAYRDACWEGIVAHFGWTQ